MTEITDMLRRPKAPCNDNGSGMILPNTRVKFRKNDIDRIWNILGKQFSNNAVIQVVSNDENLDFTCDDPEVYEKLYRNTEILDISPEFFFYVGVRKKLKESGIDDLEISDYVAAILSNFIRVERIYTPVDKEEHYVIDMMPKAEATPMERFVRYKHVGDYLLFYCGFFQENTIARHRYGRRPISIDDYIKMGSEGYKRAAAQKIAESMRLKQLLYMMYEGFREIRRALSSFKNDIGCENCKGFLISN